MKNKKLVLTFMNLFVCNALISNYIWPNSSAGILWLDLTKPQTRIGRALERQGGRIVIMSWSSVYDGI